MEKNEKSIRRIGTYFLVLGFICAFLVQKNFSPPYGNIVCSICVVLMCSPRLIYQNKKWASVLLMISAILTTLALLCFDAILIVLSVAFGLDVSGVIILGVITVIMLLSCYLCNRLIKLLFESKEAA